MFFIYEKVTAMIDWLVGVRIIRRPESLYIEDRRPTWPMLLSVLGFLIFLGAFALQFLRIDFGPDSFGMWSAGIAALVCLGLSFRGTLREVYIFDKPTDTYHFIRRYLYKKELIEGTLTQFRGAGVRTFTAEDSESYSVTLHQGGMFLGGAGDQLLRESTPIMNSWDTEARIANAIQEFLNIKREDVTS
ncbi:MAG: hypothetical protein ACJ72Z_01330 [Pyrinomonadaceae bacterium]